MTDQQGDSATDALSTAFAALRAGDRDRARQICARESSSVLGRAVSRYLADHPDGADSVYTEPSAFQAFIAGGGNIGLYEATAEAVALTYERSRAQSVLDIGPGDGAALVPALTRTGSRPQRVELVERSAALLATAENRLRAWDIEVATHRTTAQEFTRHLDGSRGWDVVQSTFALHTIPPGERDDVLRALRSRVRELVVVEFDVPDLAEGSDEQLRFLARSYEQGLSEYGADRELVAQGFLIPVLVGQLSPGAARMTFEQPAARWAEQLTRCGYRDVEVAELYPYWSSPAFVLRARGEAMNS